MKIREYIKHKQNMKKQQEDQYCQNNNVDFEEFKKAEKKNDNCALGATIGLWAFVMALCAIIGAVENNKKNNAPVTTPVITNVNRAIDLQNPIELNNVSNVGGSYSLGTEYNLHIDPKSIAYMPIDHANDRTMYFSFDQLVYYISDDLNFKGYSDEFQTNEELFNGKFVNFYDQLNTNDIYLNLLNANVGSIEQTWLNGENLNTGVSRTFNKDYSTPVYSLNFNDSYINHYNSFNKLRVHVELKTVDFGYQFSSKIYAYNSTDNVSVLIALNQRQSNNNPIASGNNLDISVNSSYLTTNYYIAPYLKDTKLHTNQTWTNFYYYDNIGYLRPWLSNEITSSQYVHIPTPTNGGEDLWNNIGDLIKVTFVSLLPIGDLYILPMVTIGALIFTPLIIGFIMLIIKVIRK